MYKFNKEMFLRSMLEFLIGYSLFGIFMIWLHAVNSSMFVYCFGSFEVFYIILAICISILRARN